ncbi:MAG: hypothetical protein C4617_02245 [Candidatus Liberibacter europaeus]|uniref:DUF475 domain-containing protein n=1 Tax=Candidatus Liberibacter europaeus TaxID=744859 RepID=A0A2T4VY02_9HYPH|nr:hypothetical protein [Candidatus Liberibacter europaeus]PTL86659.1 MAG: hypothetical protein C4617_02245 [Candidatus Liberibacter europaeus]
MKKNTSLTDIIYYCRWAIIFTIIGALLSIWVGWETTQTISGTIKTVYVCMILAIMEISLSFDNAILNAKNLQKMSLIWQKRFLTWGILIAVFGMRVIFPVMIVCILGKINPIEAINIAVFHPQDYLKIITDAHLPIAGFGGTFLMMVGLSFFFDTKKNIHWIKFVEHPICNLAVIRGSKVIIVLLSILGISYRLSIEDIYILIYSSIFALMAFYAINFLEYIMSKDNHKIIIGQGKYGFSLFLYLEIIDANLSFDGVISSFAITKNFFIIIIGLAIGAVYVRSITLLILEKGILSKYQYLEHGAFYAIIILSIVMFLQIIIEVPEVFTGTSSVILIVSSILSSIYSRRNHLTKKQI